MYLSADEIEKVSKSVIRELKSAGIESFDENKAETIIINVINQSIQDERALEEDALKLLQQHKASMGVGFDQEKALRMIKQKLAEERGFVL